MRIFKISFIALSVLLIMAAVWFNFHAESKVPQHEGSKQFNALGSDVYVTFDGFGIPHIKAQNKKDAYQTLGYLMASERLFQMDIIRRVGKGELSEVLGDKTIGADLFFRSLDLGNHAQASADSLLVRNDTETIEECLAFLEGINTFIDEGNLPLEYAIGIDARYFELQDLYAIAGYMAYSFSIAAKTDLLATEMSLQHGDAWTEKMGLSSNSLPPFNPVCFPDSTVFPVIENFLGNIGIPEFIGSNAWAVNGSKTRSGKAMMCNDTHIGYSVPQVWFEASIDCPDFTFYGNFIPGIPYALVGHDFHKSWGLTMFGNDDVDLYAERRNEDGTFLLDEGSYSAEVHEEIIKVNGKADTTVQVIKTKNGHIVNGAITEMSDFPLVALRWEYTQGENMLLDAFRSMNMAKDISSFESALELIHAPGLNIIYADSANHIARWAAARLPKHPKGVNSKKMISGHRSANILTEHYPFSVNPKCIDPSNGFVSSANEQSESLNALFIPGYYVPPARSERIRSILTDAEMIDVEFMQAMLLDVTNPDDARIALKMQEVLNLESNWNSLSPFEKECASLLAWDGSYELDAPTPVLFQPLQIRLLKAALMDEMTGEQFNRFAETHWLRRLLHLALRDPNHLVWDVVTTEPTEDMSHHLLPVFQKLCSELSSTYGSSPTDWKWGEAHTWQPQHMLKDIPFLGDWLSAESVPMRGSNETLSQSGFTPSTDIQSKGRFGAQMRIIVDFSDINGSMSITPTGQSGVWRSDHYMDQAVLYINGDFRPQYIHTADSLNFSEIKFNSVE